MPKLDLEELEAAQHELNPRSDDSDEAVRLYEEKLHIRRHEQLMAVTQIPVKCWEMATALAIADSGNPMPVAARKRVKEIDTQVANLEASIAKVTPDAIRAYFKGAESPHADVIES